MVNMIPFLVSANRAIGYRTVAAPVNVSHYFAENMSSWISQDIVEGKICRRDVKTPKGDVTLFFRKKVLETHQDSFGRNIQRYDGVLLPTKDADRIAFNAKYLDDAERINNAHFNEFWSWTYDRTPPIGVTETIQHDPSLVNDAEVMRLPSAEAGFAETVVPLREKKTKAVGNVSSITASSSSTRANISETFSTDAATTRRQFANVCTVALGMIGVGLMAHGAFAALNAKTTDSEGQRHRNWNRTLLHIAEAGAGVGATWVAVASSNGRLLGKGL